MRLWRQNKVHEEKMMCEASSKVARVCIGWASVDITPDKPVLLDGQFHARVSERVHDPITITALALEQRDAGRVIFLSCDMVGISRDVLEQVREALAARLPDFDPRHLIVSATHTHTSMVMDTEKYPLPDTDIMMPAECVAMVVERAASAAAEAWQNRAPGAVAWSYAQAVVGYNRRAVFADGSAKMYADTSVPEFVSLEGYEDHGVNLLFTFDAEENLTGMIVNLACPSQETEGESFVSADFWHEAREAIRQRVGKDVFVLPQCAPAGDQSPHLLMLKDLDHLMCERRGVTRRQEIGRRITNAVEEGLAGARADICWNPQLAHHVEELALPRRLVTDRERQQAQDEVTALEADSDMEASRKSTFLRRNREVLARYEDQQAEPDFPIELHVLRLGDVALATSPFELFLDYGIRIKARSAALQTFLTQVTCGYEGYLPTAKAVQAGSYGAGVASNNVGPEGGQVLVDRTVTCIQDVM
jgi:hypothetical protein